MTLAEVRSLAQSLSDWAHIAARCCGSSPDGEETLEHDVGALADAALLLVGVAEAAKVCTSTDYFYTPGAGVEDAEWRRVLVDLARAVLAFESAEVTS